jgi:hypothetical protein
MSDNNNKVIYALQQNYTTSGNGKRHSYQSWIVVNNFENYKDLWFINHSFIPLKDVTVPIKGFVAVQNVNGDILAIEG